MVNPESNSNPEAPSEAQKIRSQIRLATLETLFKNKNENDKNFSKENLKAITDIKDKSVDELKTTAFQDRIKNRQKNDGLGSR